MIKFHLFIHIYPKMFLSIFQLIDWFLSRFIIN